MGTGLGTIVLDWWTQQGVDFEGRVLRNKVVDADVEVLNSLIFI